MSKRTWQGVPLITVGDAVLEGPILPAAVPFVHCGVAVGVHLSEVNKDIVIRTDARPVYELTALRGHTCSKPVEVNMEQLQEKTQSFGLHWSN